MTNRRYVIGETVGSVDIMLKFGCPTLDSHEFGIENGKFRYIRAYIDMPGAEGLGDTIGGLTGGLDLDKILGGLNLSGVKLGDVTVEGLNLGSLSKNLGGLFKGASQPPSLTKIFGKGDSDRIRIAPGPVVATDQKKPRC